MPLTCDEITDKRLAEYATDSARLGPTFARSQHPLVAGHLDACSACRARLETQRGLLPKEEAQGWIAWLLRLLGW